MAFGRGRDRVRASGNGDPAGAPFRFSADSMLAFPSQHPGAPGYTTWYTLKEGGVVTVATPFRAPSDPARYRLADLPIGEWLPLEDQDGRPIPLALYVDEFGVQGRWAVR
ncbi:hypothetical protein GCM10017691_57060 [Pseudonocardia petroleophila]|uniref:Uncharacterized protein n=1 Tax=Pseudonocardia petroleophila TaxID=37331 RepID=A0A7G7MN85_9PSEU|nr:hypothetical protein [Pseudonocardia petroleophila]QNG54246.1 hypothetical protein H6H00_10305 [Pseudonocardia petroleophila]